MSELEMDLYDLYNIEENEDYIEYKDLDRRIELKRKEIIDKYKINKKCKRCGNNLIPSILNDEYDYQCLFCDEDYYSDENMIINK